jgi:hypothetical protein
MNKSNIKFRFEKKYLLDIGTAYLLKQRISAALPPDNSNPDGKYHISTLYFDDQYNTSFYEKQNGILTRDKFRVRFYNGSLDTIRLERKHKHGEMVYKSGALISVEQYQMMCCGEYSFMNRHPAASFKEFYTAHVLKRMRPVVMVGYNRQAYMYSAGNVRITFDSRLTASAPISNQYFPALPAKNMILEIKYDRFIPSFITGLLTGVQLTQQLPISKFVLSKFALQGAQPND